jgi:hypothetical protein
MSCPAARSLPAILIASPAFIVTLPAIEPIVLRACPL